MKGSSTKPNVYPPTPSHPHPPTHVYLSAYPYTVSPKRLTLCQTHQLHYGKKEYHEHMRVHVRTYIQCTVAVKVIVSIHFCATQPTFLQWQICRRKLLFSSSHPSLSPSCSGLESCPTPAHVSEGPPCSTTPGQGRGRGRGDDGSRGCRNM